MKISAPSCVIILLALLACSRLQLHAEADLALISNWPPTVSGTYPVDQPLTFALTVTNLGPDPAAGVVMTNFLPATFTLNSAVASQGNWTNTGAVVVSDFGDLASQQSATLTLTVTPAAVTLYSNLTEVGSSTFDPNLTNNLATKLGNTRPVFCYVSGTSLLEGDEGTTNAAFNIWLEGPTAQTVSMGFSIDGGTAQPGVDYIRTNGVLFFPPGVTNQTLNVTVIGDRLYEVNPKLAGESFTVYFGRITNAWFYEQRAIAVGNIIDDDPKPALAVEDVQVAEVESGTTKATFTANLSARSGVVTSFQWATVDGTALAGEDYASASGSVTIPAGQTNGTFSVSISGDRVLECDEAFSVSLFNLQNATFVRTQAVCTILSDELLLRLPAAVTEDTGVLPGGGEVVIGCPNVAGTLVSLSNSAPGLVSIPAVVLVPPGVTNAVFDVQVFDDSILNGSRSVTITASAPQHVPAVMQLRVDDNETTQLSLLVPPLVEEGSGSHTGWVSSVTAPDADVTVQLACTDTNHVQIPETVMLPAGQTSASFVLSVPNDLELDGLKVVTLTAHVQNWGDGLATLSVMDLTNLSLELPAELTEGQWATGMVHTTAAAITNLMIHLTASDPTGLAAPQTVEIPAGELTASFALQAVEDAVYLGNRSITMAATADSLRSTTNMLAVLENDPHHFTLSKVPVSREAYVYYYDLALVACDEEGAPMPTFNRSAILTASGASGTVSVLPETTDNFVQGVCTQYYYFHSWDNNVRISVSDGQGHLGQSNPFNIVQPFHHVLDLAARDLAWDATRGQVIASVWDYWNSISNVLAFINPTNGRVESTLYVGPSPGRMAISGDSRYLYVSFLGTNLVRRLDLSTRTVDLEFSLGEYVLLPGITYPLYADDMQVQPGNPELLAVSRMRPTVSPRSAGIAIFDHGVLRPLTYGYPPSFGPNFFEFGGSPARMYAYDTQVSSFTFHRLNVISEGVVGDSTAALMQGYGLDFTYGNGRIYVSNGQIFDPESGGLVGSFPNGVATIPAPDLGLVICIRQNGSYADMFQVFSESNFSLLHQHYIPGCGGLAASPLWCGGNVVAFRTTASEVYILHSDYLADRDANGLPDAWETEHFGSPGTLDGDPAADPDHDGLSNYAEYVAGTDPWDASSTVRLDVSGPLGGVVRFECPSRSGRCYRLESTTDLGAGPWQTVDELPGTGEILQFVDSASVGAAKRFYRLSVFF